MVFIVVVRVIYNSLCDSRAFKQNGYELRNSEVVGLWKYISKEILEYPLPHGNHLYP